MLRRNFVAGLGFVLAAPAAAQDNDSGQGTLNLSASLGDGAALTAGLRWRVFRALPDPDGQHRLLVESALAQPSLTVPSGDYVVHVAFGLDSATKSVTVAADAQAVKLALQAGALRIHCTANGDKPVDPGAVSLAIYVPERNNATAKLVYAKAREGEVIGVPEGNYHIASTYLDTVSVGTLGLSRGAGIPTNSIAPGDVNVAPGKIVDVTLRHRIAKVTIKLVDAPGSGALTNSTFTVLTPGGDIVRELAGAFPSLILAEGEYVVVARHDAKTYQATFTVQSGMDRDVEVLARGATN
jgi:hypothetical protein